ncbi:hypothetical protein M0657_002895 [Pyricularia oryzae]|nr:hypothetical protein M9X92_003710 [Pyricularia oryzae]KAI7928054.1 hypothetical protein M0657_002895 [Pyricularia oryzae]
MSPPDQVRHRLFSTAHPLVRHIKDISTVPTFTFIPPFVASLTYSPHRSTIPWPGSKEDQSLQMISLHLGRP